jgi:aspartyl-tRNA(Asn)/glutamyl-tRNA(Gln) amidotransferase subunit A
LGQSVDDVSRVAAALNIQLSACEVGPGIRVGAIHYLETVPLEPVVEEAFRLACTVLAEHFQCSRVTDLTAFTGAFESFAGIVLAEGGVTHFSRHDMDTIERLYEAETVTRLRLSANLNLGDYGRHQKRRREIKSSVSDLMREYDFLVLPTCPCVAPKVGTEGITIGPWSGTVRQALMSNTSAFNLTGMPSISVPWPVEDGGLPIGIQLVGTLGDDARLLNFAHEVEAIFQGHTSKAGIHT